jgi:hypothetical protein
MRIFPEYKPRNKQKWGFSVSTDDLDRVDTETQPHASGFYHFPSTISSEQAFERLKTCIMETHTQEVTRLQKSLCELAELQYKE